MLEIDITQIIRNMKAFRLLVTSLLVALSMGFTSCGDDNISNDSTNDNTCLLYTSPSPRD